MIGSSLSSLYKNRPVLLWVEDPLTRSYLHVLWQDPKIGLLVAGGNEAVYGAVRDARRSGHQNVFGFRDRDFVRPNRATWLDPAKGPDVFVPDVFEVENYLLDFSAMAGMGPVLNAKGVSEADLEKEAHRLATESAWWMSARSVISAAREIVQADFPTHPEWGERTTFTARELAIRELRGKLSSSTWAAGISRWTSRAWFWRWWWDEIRLHHGWIDTNADQHHSRHQSWLSSGAWRYQWSGKELFEALVEVVYPLPPKSVRQARQHLTKGQRRAAKLEDVVKGIARQQIATSTVPIDMVDLRTALRKRSGLDPW